MSTSENFLKDALERAEYLSNFLSVVISTSNPAAVAALSTQESVIIIIINNNVIYELLFSGYTTAI